MHTYSTAIIEINGLTGCPLDFLTRCVTQSPSSLRSTVEEHPVC